MTTATSRWADALRVSPQQIDPLSWITRPWVSLSFAALVLLYGLTATLMSWPVSKLAVLDLAAVVAMTGACVYIQIATRPLRPPFTPTRALIPLLLTLIGLALSTWASMSSEIPVHN